MTVTTPLSGTTCRPSAGTCYIQPSYQIWRVCDYLQRRNERHRQM